MDWKRKLTSRKLWAAVAEFVTMLLMAFNVAEETAVQIAALIMAGAGVIAYIIGEGLIDAASAKAGAEPAPEQYQQTAAIGFGLPEEYQEEPEE